MSTENQLQVQEPEEFFNFTRYLIETNLDINPGRSEKIAYIDDSGQISYGELMTKARTVASTIRTMGIQPEQRVLVVMLDSIDLPILFLGCLYAGVVPVLVNTLLNPADYVYMLKHSRAQAVFVSGALLETVETALDSMQQNPEQSLPLIVSGQGNENQSATLIPFVSLLDSTPMHEPHESHRDDIAFWLYSSGSTGNPKGTVHTHGNLFWTSELYGKRTLQMNAEDVVFSSAKIFFAYGLGNSLTFPLSVGATVVLMAGRPTPDAVFEQLTNQQSTIFFGAPTLYAALLAYPEPPPASAINLRISASAGEPLPEDLGRRFKKQFACDVLDGIGSTEMLHIYLSNKLDDVQYGKTGTPVEGYEVEIRDPHGRPVAQGEIGDLYVKGPSASLMYWANREKTRDTFQGEWTRSGDKFICDEQGYYIYSGRSDDMIKVSGQYVSPIEVEATLISHEAVLESAVVGKADAEGLTRTHAYVILQQEYTASDELGKELKEFVKAELTPHKYPRFIHFVEDLPKTATGKIQRFKLRDD